MTTVRTVIDNTRRKTTTTKRPASQRSRSRRERRSEAAQPRQLALFELKDGCRPATERTAAGRYAEPTFFAATPARRESVS
jgi:hypothetical protein